MSELATSFVRVGLRPYLIAALNQRLAAMLAFLFFYNSSKEAMKEILQYLKKHGERLDTEIAAGTGISLTNVRIYLSELTAKREIMSCYSIKFEKGKKIEGICCRLTGYIPPATPGRKSKAQLSV